MVRNEFQLDPTKDKEFPHRPPLLKSPTLVTIDMTLPKRAIFKMGVYGEISYFLSDQTEISFLVTHMYIKNVDTHHESFS